MHQTSVDDLPTLIARITEAIKFLVLERLQNSLRIIEYDLDVLRATKEAHF